jgi:hypothetical protein
MASRRPNRTAIFRHPVDRCTNAGHRGNEPKYGPEHAQRILALLDKPPPAGYSNWTAPLLARDLANIHEQQIWRFLRAPEIELSGRKSWCQSTDPDFVPKAACESAPK